jgi:galactonate dehydratase
VKITAIRPLIVNAKMRNWIFVRVETDAGVTGWGEASLEWKTRAVVGAIMDLEPFIIGQDPRRIEHLVQIMYRQPFFRGGIVTTSAASWDILGKSLDVPIYQLLGGAVRDRVRMYDHLGGGEMQALYLDDAPEVMAQRARESVAAGYTAVKVLAVPRTLPVDGPEPVKRAVRVMAAIRQAVGDGVDIMVDFHGRTTPAMGIAYAEALAPYRPLFIEEPALPEHPDGLAQVARAVTIPVASGERLVTRFQFRELLEKGACAVIQPDLCHCGGIWEARKIAAMAEAYYVAVAPHNPLGPIATAACIHFALATPNFLIQEAIRSDVPWRDTVVTPPRIVDGHALPYEKPGLGIEVNEAEAVRHPFQQEELLRYWHDDGSVADW